MTEKQKTDFSSVESRRNSASGRRMTPARRVYYFLGMPVLRALLRLLNSTYRYEPIIGAHYIEAFIEACQSYGIKSVVRTGTVAMPRHPRTQSQQ